MTSDDYIKELQTKIVQQSKEISRLNEKCTLLKKENYNLANINNNIHDVFNLVEDVKYLLGMITRELQKQ